MTVRSAATVVLLRDTPYGIETFILRRATTMAFAPRMHVFPGGRVDDIDYRERVAFASGDEAALAERGSTDVAGIRALYSCAVRESAEEAGIVIAERDAEGRLLIDPATLPLVDHWVTPEGESHRYDVRFFATVVHDGVASLTTTEADEAFWVAPDEAIRAFESGDLAMLPPTEAVLRWLGGFADAREAIRAGADQSVLPKLPRLLVDPDGSSTWALVHDRTGEVLVRGVAMPHTREVDGLPRQAT